MKLTRALILLTLIVNTSIAQVKDEDIIFGDVELGKSLKIEKCTAKDELYSSSKNNCYDELGEYYLHFPSQERPIWLQWGRYAPYAVQIKLFNEIVGSVVMTTSGVTVQNEVLRILTNKYGNPEVNKTTEKSNAYGAKMNSIEATWTKNNIVISFSGVDSANSGHVEISTKDYLAYMKSKEVKKKEL